MARSSLSWGALLAACLVGGPAAGGEKGTPVVPLKNAHAHNDYEHKRPLLDALDHGFCSVEADVFLVGKDLLVGHTRSDLRPGRTLEALYLEPLRRRAQANGGRIYPGGPPFYLLIDVKTAAGPTWAALADVLARYDDLLTVARDGKVEHRAVTVVISGERDRAALTGQAVIRAGLDGRPEDLASDLPAYRMPWISARWGALFGWQGEGPMPESERARLRAYVRQAHERGRLVRFWATPDRPALWRELRAAGVDLINTDRLAELRDFLLKEAGPQAGPRPEGE